MGAAPKRLLIRPGALGDCVVSLPALQCLDRGHTAVWLPGAYQALIQFTPHVRSLASTGLDLLGLPEVEAPPDLAARLRSFEEIVSWYGTARPEFRAALEHTGVPVRFFPALPRADSTVHAIDFFLEHARQVEPECAATTPTLHLPRRRGDYLVIHPFSGSARKNWPLERFRQLAAALPVPVFWLAGPDEELDGAARYTDLAELMIWLAGARLYLGNDAGVTHLAAALGVPVVALFGPTRPEVWAPRGPAVWTVRTPQEGAAMEGISVEAVVEAVLVAWAASSD